MRFFGWMLAIIGLGLVFWASSMTTSIHANMDYIPGVGLQEAKDVYNLGLLQQQMMLLQSGLASSVSGIFVVCIGQLRMDMRQAGTVKFEGMFDQVSAEAAQVRAETTLDSKVDVTQ